MTRMHIPPGETGMVRLFAVDLPPEEARRFAEGAPGSVARALGVPGLGARHVEVFETQDLKGVGLSGYLRSGLGVGDAALAGDRQRLDDLTGTVAVVLSGALEGREETLRVAPPLRWIGTWQEAGAETPETRLDPSSARDLSNVSEAGAPVGRAGGRATLWVVLGLLALAVVILVLLLG